MYCKKCWHRNILKAEYCRSCGEPFTEEEREAAYKKTPFGWIDKFLELKAWTTLGPITGSNWFRILVLAGIALYALAVLLVNGTHMRIMNSPDYDVQLNTTTGMYTLKTEEDTVALRLYIPQQVESYDVLTMDQYSEILAQQTFDPEEAPVLEYQPGITYVVSTPSEHLQLQVELA